MWSVWFYLENQGEIKKYVNSEHDASFLTVLLFFKQNRFVFTFTGITSLLAILLILTLYKHERSDALHSWRLSIFMIVFGQVTNSKSGKTLRLSEPCFPVVKHLLPSTYLRYWLIQDLFMWRTYVFIGTLGAVQVSCD